MDKPLIKFSFECLNCNETFRIHNSQIFDRNNITCPNCGSVLPNNVLEHLKETTRHLNQAFKEYSKISQLKSGIKEKWHLSIDKGSLALEDEIITIWD